jgi:hypothetical protein
LAVGEGGRGSGEGGGWGRGGRGGGGGGGVVAGEGGPWWRGRGGVVVGEGGVLQADAWGQDLNRSLFLGGGASGTAWCLAAAKAANSVSPVTQDTGDGGLVRGVGLLSTRPCVCPSTVTHVADQPIAQGLWQVIGSMFRLVGLGVCYCCCMLHTGCSVRACHHKVIAIQRCRYASMLLLLLLVLGAVRSLC